MLNNYDDTSIDDNDDNDDDDDELSYLEIKSIWSIGCFRFSETQILYFHYKK